MSYSRVVSVAFVPVFVVAAILAIDLWVYRDATRYAAEGTPVTMRIGTFVVETPIAWFLGCLVLWVIFFPLYVVSRSG